MKNLIANFKFLHYLFDLKRADLFVFSQQQCEDLTLNIPTKELAKKSRTQIYNDDASHKNVVTDFVFSKNDGSSVIYITRVDVTNLLLIITRLGLWSYSKHQR